LNILKNYLCLVYKEPFFLSRYNKYTKYTLLRFKHVLIIKKWKIIKILLFWLLFWQIHSSVYQSQLFLSFLFQLIILKWSVNFVWLIVEHKYVFINFMLLKLRSFVAVMQGNVRVEKFTWLSRQCSCFYTWLLNKTSCKCSVWFGFSSICNETRYKVFSRKPLIVSYDAIMVQLIIKGAGVGRK